MIRIVHEKTRAWMAAMRHAIRTRLLQGHTVQEITTELGCSADLVWRVHEILQDEVRQVSREGDAQRACG